MKIPVCERQATSSTRNSSGLEKELMSATVVRLADAPIVGGDNMRGQPSIHGRLDAERSCMRGRTDGPTVPRRSFPRLEPNVHRLANKLTPGEAVWIGRVTTTTVGVPDHTHEYLKVQ